MDGNDSSDHKPNGPNTDKTSEKGVKYGNGSEDENESNVNQDMVTSESKTPLKTPLKDGDAEAQVKFIVNDSVNGDAKIDIDNVKSAFAGMSKEELMKYANDPFWIKMRMFLFIFFWGVWIAMFVGAIAIIVMAPRCEAPKKPTWYQQGPLYEVDLENFNTDSGSLLQGLKDKLAYLADLQIKGIILSSIFKTISNNTENVVDFKSIDEKFGSLDNLKALINESQAFGINITLTFVPNHSSNKHEWFSKSVAKEAPYDQYYVWSPGSGKNSDGSRLPPNNWLSVKGGSAWTWNDQRGEFYLHQFEESQPDLNFNNQDVVREFNDTFSYWLDLGISGFHLEKAQYLLEDTEFGNETIGDKPGAVHTDYEFYSHQKTYNRPQTANLLSSWRDVIHEKTNGNGLLMITGDAPIPSDISENMTIVDLTRNNRILSNLKSDFSASDLYPRLERIINLANNSKSWPTIQLGTKNSRIGDRFGEDYVDGLTMITMFLPGTPITYYGEELGLSGTNSISWGNETKGVETQNSTIESHLGIYKTLVKAKNDPAVLFGKSDLKVLSNNTLAFTRIKPGHPGYLVVFNPSPYNTTVDAEELQLVPDELTVLIWSKNYQSENIRERSKVKSKEVFLSPKSAVAFTFAPKKE